MTGSSAPGSQISSSRFASPHSAMPPGSFAATPTSSNARFAAATWVVRAHHVEYLRPALREERIRVRTWVEGFRRVMSLRKYEFTRADDNTLLARGQTEWVFVDAQTGRPKSIPPAIQALFTPP